MARKRPVGDNDTGAAAVTPAPLDPRIRRIAEALGRHLARKHFKLMQASQGGSAKPPE